MAHRNGAGAAAAETVSEAPQAARKPGLFPTWQPEYAAHKIATFPVRIVEGAKRPAVKNYGRVGLPASAKLAAEFANDNAFGFMAGDRSKITVLDVDTKDEKVLSDALARHGQTPLLFAAAAESFMPIIGQRRAAPHQAAA